MRISGFSVIFEVLFLCHFEARDVPADGFHAAVAVVEPGGLRVWVPIRSGAGDGPAAQACCGEVQVENM